MLIEVSSNSVKDGSPESSQIACVVQDDRIGAGRQRERTNQDSGLSLAFRQIHVDFHTSEKVQDIANKFDPAAFADTLKKTQVNAVTLFSRCHHGWLYHNSARFPERKHPHLEQDLLREQIDACQESNIEVSIYTSVQHDHYSAVRHPEWCCFDETGKIICFHGVFDPGFNRILCVNSPYRDFLKEHIKELFEIFEVPGLFFDIVRPYACSCRYCCEKMAAANIDPTQEENRQAFGLQTINEFKLDMSRFIRSFNPDCRIFYNSGSISPHQAAAFDAYSHFELESLPSTYGYLSFHALGSYARSKFDEVTGMTSRFHRNWGDFHSYRHPAAMEFECFRTLAEGLKCCVGDHLHPAGEPCSQTYDTIGKIYSRIESLEPYCAAARPLAEVGVIFPDHEPFPDGVVPDSLLGVTDLLLRNKYQYQILDFDNDLSDYKVLILPDDVRLDSDREEKIAQYIANGGKILASHNAGRREKTGDFAEAMELEFVSESEFSVEYVSLMDEWFSAANSRTKDRITLKPNQEYVMYQGGLCVRPTGNAKAIVSTVSPYFERQYDSFFSHLHAPSNGREIGPAVIKGKNSIYFAHPIFQIYREWGPYWCEQMFNNALDSLLGQRIVEVQAPSHVICKVHEQKERNRLVVHLLNYRSYKKGKDIEQVDDVVPLFDVDMTLQTAGRVQSVRRLSDHTDLIFSQDERGVQISLPRLDGYEVVVISLADNSLA